MEHIEVQWHGDVSHQPYYASEGAAGADLFAAIDKEMSIAPHQWVVIPTGVWCAIPEGYEGQVRARSGLSVRHGVTVLNGVGTIDSDYRGEIKVPLINFGAEEYVIRTGDRIAQLVITHAPRAHFVRVSSIDSLTNTTRMQNGFGSSGR